MTAMTPMRSASGTYVKSDRSRAVMFSLELRFAGRWPTPDLLLPMPLRLPTFCTTIDSLIAQHSFLQIYPRSSASAHPCSSVTPVLPATAQPHTPTRSPARVARAHEFLPPAPTRLQHARSHLQSR